MKKLMNLCFSCFILVGCVKSKKQANFQIINNTSNYIVDIAISNGVNQIYIDTLMPNISKELTLDFKDVPRNDGGYRIDYKLNSEEIFENFGYYSNGVPTESKYQIEIMKDTLIVKEQMNK